MAQTTSTNSGNATLIKRGDAAPNASFFSGAWTVFVRHRVTDWTTNSGSGYLNIFEGNCDPASSGSTAGGLFQLYYNVTSDEIRLYVGEAWTVVDSLVRSGGHTGWATYAFRCAGSTSDPVEFAYVFDDQSVVTSATIGSTNGGALRQLLAVGGVAGEEPNNTRNATICVFKVKLTDAEILTQRATPNPIYTGTNLFFFNSGADATTVEVDGSGNANDFTVFNDTLATTVSDVPALWAAAPVLSAATVLVNTSTSVTPRVTVTF